MCVDDMKTLWKFKKACKCKFTNKMSDTALCIVLFQLNFLYMWLIKYMASFVNVTAERNIITILTILCMVHFCINVNSYSHEISKNLYQILFACLESCIKWNNLTPGKILFTLYYILKYSHNKCTLPVLLHGK